LADTIKEVSYLAIRDGDRALNILQVPAPLMVQSVEWLGSGSLHSTSTGKVFLAHMPDAEVESYLSQPLGSYTTNTITDANQLRDELKLVRERGYATSWEEEDEGVNAIAVPVRKGKNKVVAAIGVFGPSYRFTTAKALEAPEMMFGVAREVGKQLQPPNYKVFV
jgi:DNA-binding IclR family transcriptional regulator